MQIIKKKKFIDAKLADFLAKGALEVLGPDVAEIANKCGINLRDMIRFQPVPEMCCKEREKKGFTFKQVALSLNVPQYHLKYIESSNLKNIKIDILESYIDYLGLCKWFSGWKRHNMDVYNRLSREK